MHAHVPTVHRYTCPLYIDTHAMTIYMCINDYLQMVCNVSRLFVGDVSEHFIFELMLCALCD